MLASMGDGKRCIANLGHGILPDTPVESVRAMVDAVVEWRR
jgi:uroporphyrinogen-III decarboxylase